MHLLESVTISARKQFNSTHLQIIGVYFLTCSSSSFFEMIRSPLYSSPLKNAHDGAVSQLFCCSWMF